MPASSVSASSTDAVRKSASERAKKKSGVFGGMTLSIEVDEREGDGDGACDSPVAKAGGSKRGVQDKPSKRVVREHPAVR